METKPKPVRFFKNVSTVLRKNRQGLLNKQPVQVPCGDCNACCKTHVVNIDHKIDDASKYKTTEWNGMTILEQKANGECVHFIDNKCSIYDDRPMACKTFDCRLNAFVALIPTHPITGKILDIQKWKAQPTNYDDIVDLIAFRIVFQKMKQDPTVQEYLTMNGAIQYYTRYRKEAEKYVSEYKERAKKM